MSHGLLNLKLCLVYFPIMIFGLKSELEQKCDSLTVQHVYGLGRCFALTNETEQMIWSRWTCIHLPHGRLAILDTKESMEFITANLQFTNRTPWIGLTRVDTTGEYTEGWTWIIGETETKPEPYDEEKWTDEHPRNHTYTHCGSLSKSAKYLDYRCNNGRPVLCQYGNDTSATPKGPIIFRMIAEGKRGGTGSEMTTKQMATKGLRMKCANLCVKQQTCQSIAVNEQDGTCKLYSQKWTQNQWIDDAEYKLFDKQ